MSLAVSEDVGLSYGSLQERSSSGKCARSWMASRQCREKSQFLAKEMWQSERLVAQLAVAHQEVVELAPTAREVADLQVREKDTHDNTHEVEEKLTALIKRLCTDTMEQQINHLKDELQGERDLKVVAEGMSFRLTVEVGQRQKGVRRLEAEVTQQRDELRRLRVDMNGLDDKLGVKVVKSRSLEKELSEVKDTFQKESGGHDNLRIAI
ncbi:uncharacterized protein [Miscanthus floridulus]|uniref:uncharacterized protein n=1 Tax=Miscanthus floridulus TaxID=154761 RepID=UPI00345994BE